MVNNNLDSIAVLGDHLIRLLGSCGSLEEANQVFCNIPKPSVYSWNAIISAHAKLGKAYTALALYHEMQENGTRPDKITLVCILQACGSAGAASQGRRIHEQIIRIGVQSELLICNTLVNMYCKCGRLEDARRVFNYIQFPNVVSWGAMISGYSQHERGHTALQLFEKMQQGDVTPDRVIFLSVLKACGSLSAIGHGRLIHEQILKYELGSDSVLGSSLVDMYSNCGSLQDAQKVFDDLADHDVVLWGSLIAGYVEHGFGIAAIELFEKMQDKGITPGKVVFLSALKACGMTGVIALGQLIHSQIIGSGLSLDVVVGNTLIDMYAKCGSLIDAHEMFDELVHRDAVSWAVMISGYATYDYNYLALELYDTMQKEGIKPNKATLLYILKACGSAQSIAHGRLIHDQIIDRGLQSDLVIGSTLVEMYAKCGTLSVAQKVFDQLSTRDVVSWGAMIRGYVQNGHQLVAFELFEEMQQEGVKPDIIVFSSLLKACGNIGALEQGMLTHCEIIRNGLELDAVSSIVDMYAKCGSLLEARIGFCDLQTENMTSWGSMIAGYAENGHSFSALELFIRMQQDGLQPNIVIFSCVLKACANMGALGQGRLIHQRIIRDGVEVDGKGSNTLVDMYAKCGSVEDAKNVFDASPNQDVVSWGAMAAGYALHGRCTLAVDCLREMRNQGLQPDAAMFSSILAAYCHAVMLEEACFHFTSMREVHGIEPSIEHFSCIVDLFGRAGCLVVAEDVIRTMHMQPDIMPWMSLLTSCRTYGNIELGRNCFSEVVQLDPHNASGYVHMANTYANAHVWEDVKDMQELRKFAGVRKKPGGACIEINNNIHDFIVGFKNLAQSPHFEIYSKLKTLGQFMELQGYVPQLDLVLDPMLEEHENGLHAYIVSHKEPSAAYAVF